MTPFTVHAADSAPSDSRPLLEGIRRGFGFVPNLFAVIAESPAALRGALSIHEAFAAGSLTPAEQQLVMLAVSEANECAFCMAAHSTFAAGMKVAPALVAAVRARKPLGDAKLDALVVFTRKVVEQRGWVEERELATFLEAGYSRAQVIEVLLGVGMKTFNNYVDHIAHTPLNDEFKAQAWQPARKAA